MEYPLIHEHELTTRRPAGGQLDSVELIQRADGRWQINIAVSWRPGIISSVAKFSVLEIKLYAMAATALRHIVDKYRYYGPIIVKPREGLLPRTLI